jgi:hypothetical protein
VADKFVEFFEGAFVQKQIDAFAGAELALFVLAFAALRAAARFGFRVSFAEFFEAIVMLARRGHRANSGKSKMEIRKSFGPRAGAIAIFLTATHGFMLRLENVTWLCFE